VYLRAKHGVEIPFVKADIRDYNEIESVIRKHEINGIVHTAALKAVGESMEKSDEYFQVNLEATTELLRIAERNGVKKFIFSSTAAVYGSPDSIEPCTEEGPKAPISPYGDSKYQAESKVTAFINTPGNHGTSLRFFNVVGTAAPELLDNSVENLVPIVLGKLNKGEAPVIFGTDYPTPDGTCIRDYVDVRDIARAHLAAADATTKLPPAMNIGTGRGASVREIIKLVLEAINKSDTAVIEDPRRAGDPAILCADINLAKSAMGFTSQYPLEASIRSLF
jgi:UDP-glucose 4-epimerase